MKPDPSFAFVLGTGRCGSTLVHEVLARHPDVAFVSNVEDRLPFLPAALGRWNGDLYRRVPAALTRKGRLRYAPSEGYRVLASRVSPALVAPDRDLVAGDATPWLADRARRFFTARAAAQGRPVLLHKFTGWPRAGFLDRTFPGARFVHVVRDGRAVANSFLQMPWWRGFEGPERWGWGPLPSLYREEWEDSGRSFPVLAGIQWKMLLDAYDEARADLPADRWLEVRYEDVVAAPREQIGAILTFLGLGWDPAFERAFAGHRFSAGRTEAYRDDLGIHEVAMLDRVLRPHLIRYGYVTDKGSKGRDTETGTARG